MADQEQVSKQNVYADIGVPPTSEGVSKVVIYAIVNNNPPPVPPPPSSQVWIYG